MRDGLDVRVLRRASCDFICWPRNLCIPSPRPFFYFMSKICRRNPFLILGSRLCRSGLVQEHSKDTQPLSPRVPTYDETPCDLPIRVLYRGGTTQANKRSTPWTCMLIYKRLKWWWIAKAAGGRSISTRGSVGCFPSLIRPRYSTLSIAKVLDCTSSEFKR